MPAAIQINSISESKPLKLVSLILVAIFTIVLVSFLASIRAWYKPSIKAYEVSPMTVILEQDTKVTDRLLTDKKRQEARESALDNIGATKILTENREADQISFDSLKFVTKAIREELSPMKQRPEPLNPGISLDTQEYLLELSSEDFADILAIIQAGQVPSSQNTNYLAELRKLKDVEREYFMEELSKLRMLQAKKQAVIKDFGKIFIETISKFDYEEIFNISYKAQKKLLGLGLVHGLPGGKIKENIAVLYPELSPVKLNLISKLVSKTTQANIKINWRKVNEIENSAESSVPDVRVELKAGRVLAEKGKMIDVEDYYYLKNLGMLRPMPDWDQVTDNFYYVLLFAVFITIGVTFSRVKRYALQDVVLISFVLLAIIGTAALVSIWGVNKLPILPLATLSILMTVFYLPVMAFILVGIVSFFMVYSFDMSIWQVLPLLTGSIYSIFLLRKAHQREDIANAGTKVAISQVLVFALTVVLAAPNFSVLTVLKVAALYAVSGILSSLIAMATLPYLEASLKLLTPFKLAELSNPSQPLLKKLKEEAPGTYQHSLNVSRFSEEASNALGLNTELVRVGLLYHDIGKTYNPEYFIENNLGKENPHEKLDDPRGSARIIIDHVPEGIKLAKKANLPQAIIDFIPMHQGTTITNYFFFKAKERYGEANVDPNNFRYPGPRPNTKETGIAMMADSVEAAVKSLKDLANEETVADMIEKIITARQNEGELAEAGLTDDDLTVVSKSFLAAWKSQNHERVQYPEDGKE